MQIQSSTCLVLFTWRVVSLSTNAFFFICYGNKEYNVTKVFNKSEPYTQFCYSNNNFRCIVQDAWSFSNGEHLHYQLITFWSFAMVINNPRLQTFFNKSVPLLFKQQMQIQSSRCLVLFTRRAFSLSNNYLLVMCFGNK